MPSHPVSLWSISVLSSHLLLGLGVFSFLQYFKDETSLLVLTNHKVMYYINQLHTTPVLSVHSRPHVSALPATIIRNCINFDTRQNITSWARDLCFLIKSMLEKCKTGEMPIKYEGSSASCGKPASRPVQAYVKVYWRPDDGSHLRPKHVVVNILTDLVLCHWLM